MHLCQPVKKCERDISGVERCAGLHACMFVLHAAVFLSQGSVET